MHYIYRVSDRNIVGKVGGRRTRALDELAHESEILKIVNSELGGVAEDYAAVYADQEETNNPVINEDLTVTFLPDPPPRDFKAEYAAARADTERINILAERMGIA